jgi:putative transport protein
VTGVFQFLQDQPFFTIFAVVAIGMAIGRRSIGGVSVGSVVGIILTGLAASIAAHNAGVSLEFPDVLKTVFFNLFIFSMGVKIGPQFFAGLERDGWHMVIVGLVVAVLAPLLAVLTGVLFDLPQGAVAGVLAGSNNSSATFGTASSAVQSGAVTVGPGGSLDLVAATLSASFALCYTVSEIQFVLFMKWLPGLAGIDAPAEARKFEATMTEGRSSALPGTVEAADFVDATITARAYRATAPYTTHTLGDIRRVAPQVSIDRVRRSGIWIPLADETPLAEGDEVVVSGPLTAQVRVREALGPEIPDAEARTLTPIDTVDVVVARDEATGRPLPELIADLLPGLQPNAVFRAGEELPPASTALKRGDVIRVTGTESGLEALGTHVGHVIRASHASDLVTLSIGLLIGGALGAIPVPLFGLWISFGAAAVLVTGIMFGWLKTRRPALGGQLSEGARSLLEEMGLNVFTAVLAIDSGRAVYEVVVDGPVVALVISCLIVSSIPSLVAWWIGRHLLHLNPALLMGAIAGARQNTASLRAAQRETGSAVPGIGYPVPLAITTVTMSVVGYLFAIRF